MDNQKYSIKAADNTPETFYLELTDLSEAAIQIWEEEGEKKAFVRIRLTKEELEKIIHEYKHLQTL